MNRFDGKIGMASDLAPLIRDLLVTLKDHRDYILVNVRGVVGISAAGV